MTLYNPNHIDEREILRQVDRWRAQQLVTPEQVAAIEQAFPKRFRQTNPWLEIGAFLFTTLAVMSLYGLVSIRFEVFGSTNAAPFGLLSMAYAGGLLALTRYLVQTKNLCRNGTDNALLVLAAGIGSWGLICLVASFRPDFPPFWQCALLALPILLALVWWSGDVILTYLALGTFYALLFDRLIDFSWGKAALPFVLMGVSAGLYALVRRESHRAYYAETLGVVRWLSLAMVLAAGNYYVVRELNALLLSPAPDVSPEISLAGLFWAFTFGLPLTYLIVGFRGRNRMFLMLGTLGVAAAVATFRHYHVTWPLSVVLAVDGALVIGLAVWLIRYLRPEAPGYPRHGFTDAPDDELPHVLLHHVGTLTTLQATANAQNHPHLRFGDGDFGGAGAGKNY